MFASSLCPGARTRTGAGHDAAMTGRRLRLFGRGPGSRHPDRGPRDAGAAVAAEPERAVARADGLAPVLTIDALGRKCPIPIIMLAEQIRDVPLGAIVAVLADDPAAYTDVPSWCVMKAHEFAGYDELTRGWALYIRRAV
jgi:tRNA 2-thiouridine synthesizing protein A